MARSVFAEPPLARGRGPDGEIVEGVIDADADEARPENNGENVYARKAMKGGGQA